MVWYFLKKLGQNQLDFFKSMRKLTPGIHVSDFCYEVMPKISNKWLYWYCCYLESLQNFLKSHFATNCIKSYLCYKRITSQNMCHLRHRLRIFLFNRKVMFRSRDIQVFVILTILWFIKYVTPWWVLVQETGCISEYIFWITTH